MPRNLQENRPWIMSSAWIAVFAGFSLSACQRPAQQACSDAPVMQCATPPVCAFDDKMGCVVCKCAAPPYVPAQQTDPTQLPQPQR